MGGEILLLLFANESCQLTTRYPWLGLWRSHLDREPVISPPRISEESSRSNDRTFSGIDNPPLTGNTSPSGNKPLLVHCASQKPALSADFSTGDCSLHRETGLLRNTGQEVGGVSRMNKELRKLIKARSGGTCEKCKVNTAEHIHHLSYRNVPHEKPEDLQHICLVCHGNYHPHHNFRPMGEQYRIAARRKAFRASHPRKEGIDWGPEIKKARRELKAAKRFNGLYMYEREE